MEKLLCEVLRELQATNRLIERLARAIEAQQSRSIAVPAGQSSVVRLRSRNTLPIG